MCIPENLKIEKKDGTFVAVQKEVVSEDDAEQEVITYTYNPSKKTFKKEKTDMFYYESEEIVPVANGFVKNHSVGSCGSGEISQTLYSKDGKKVTSLAELKKELLTVR